MDDNSSIEIMYGLGGSIWSTNALNGMINVILKSAFETEDTLLKAQIGSQNRKVTARTGWAVSDRTSARFYASYGDRLPGESELFDDSWKTSRVGFQSDSRFSSQSLLTISGEAYSSKLGVFRYGGNRTTGNIDAMFGYEEQTGYNAQAKWTHQNGSDGGYSARVWIGYSEFEGDMVNFDFNASGFEFRSRSLWKEKHELVFTSSGTFSKFDFSEHPLTSFTENANETAFQGTAAVQYDYKIVPSKVTLSTGATLHYSNITDHINWLPSLSAIFHINENSRLWTSYSRVYRSIPQAFRDAEYLEFMAMPIASTEIPSPLGVLTIDRAFVYARSSDSLKDEQLDNFEAGYRQMLGRNTELRINTFYSLYEDVISVVSGLTAPELGFGTEHLYLMQYLDLYNAAKARTWGGEISLKTHFKTGTSLLVNYAYLKEKASFYEQYSNIPDSMAVETLGISPQHQASLWFSQDLMANARADVGLRYSGSYSNLLGTQNAITQLDLRLSWNPTDQLRLSLVGRNLLDNDINETVHRDLLTFPSGQSPEWYLELKWEF